MIALRPGIVGLGQVAWRFDEEPGRTSVWSHAGAYRATDYAAPVAYDVDPAVRSAFAARFVDATVVDSIDEFVASRPDVVSICTPNGQHAEALQAILPAAPRAIWCEKPLATGLADARTMVSACAERTIPLLVSHVRRWSPLWRRFKARLDAGEIGALRSLRVAMPNRLWSIGSHAVDLLLWLGGPVVQVQRFNNMLLEEDGEPACDALFAFASGTVGHLQVTGLKTNLLVEAEAIGDNGRLTLSEGQTVIRAESFKASERYEDYRELVEAGTEAIEMDADISPFTAIATEICGLLDGALDRPTCSGEDALAVQEILASLAEPGGLAKTAE